MSEPSGAESISQTVPSAVGRATLDDAEECAGFSRLNRLIVRDLNGAGATSAEDATEPSIFCSLTVYGTFL